MKTFIENKGRTVEDVARETYPTATYDYALPQTFVNAMQDRLYFDPRGRFVWLYPSLNRATGLPGPLDIEALSALLSFYAIGD